MTIWLRLIALSSSRSAFDAASEASIKTMILPLLTFLTLTGLTACGSINSLQSLTEGDRIDYKSVSKTPSLEIPPDLTQLQNSNRYTVPQLNGSPVSASDYTSPQALSVSAAEQKVAPRTIEGMHIERSGNQHWLVVKQTPEMLWPRVRNFWESLGFVIQQDSPQTGVMETDWAENRAKIPQDLIRNTLGKIVEGLYSTSERDKFRTRFERGTDGATEIYISHRGMQEVLTGAHQESSTWTARPIDPGLEAEFLSRLMSALALESSTALSASAKNPVVQLPHAKIVRQANKQPYVELDQGFDQAWRRVGLALDQTGFTVEDRDRTRGIYMVRYVDPARDEKQKKGFFSKWFGVGSGKDKIDTNIRYQILIKSEVNTEVSLVQVLNDQSVPDTTETAGKILSLITEQLK